MKHTRQNSVDRSGGAQIATTRKKSNRGRRWGNLAITLLVLALLLVVARALMPSMVRNYVNKTLDRNQLYSGTIGPVRIHLWRGAYSIDDVTISKVTANVPVPFFSAKRVDFAIQWDALMHGKVVGRLLMVEPQINYVDAPTESESQTGNGGPWLQMIRDLSPFSINQAV